MRARPSRSRVAPRGSQVVWVALVAWLALVGSAFAASAAVAHTAQTASAAMQDSVLAALDRAVLAARDRAERLRARDTTDGDARERHPVRIAEWLVEWRRSAPGNRRQALAAAVLLHADTLQLDSTTAHALGASLDPTSRAWTLAWARYADAAGAALRLVGWRRLTPERASVNAGFRVRWLSALDSVVARVDAHPAARFDALVRATRVRGRREGVRAAQAGLAQLSREFPREHDTEITIAAFGTARPTAVGRVAPAFRVRSLDGSTMLTRDSLAGRVVLLDFWATWCAPCIEELPNIARAWSRHRGEGFEVLSVSLDQHAGLVARFRRTHPMPWRHGFASILDDLPVVFGVTQVPRAILLGRDGTILAMDDELRGRALEETVRAALAPPR